MGKEDLATRILVTSNGVLLRHREAAVDCQTGNVTEVRQYISGNTAAVTELGYDTAGLLTTVEGPANLHGQRYTLTYSYDNVVGTYITRIHDSFGYTSTAAYDYKFGLPLLTTDINGNQTRYAYDAYGRLTSVVGPEEIGCGFRRSRAAVPVHAGTDSGGCRRLQCRDGERTVVQMVTGVNGPGTGPVFSLPRFSVFASTRL